MKKSVLFLINGLGIEKPGSYSISIDQCMPNLAKTKETSYFNTGIINSIEYRSAYEQFFLGQTYRTELKYIKEQILNENLGSNPTYQNFVQNLNQSNCKLHVFLEPTTENIVDQVNSLIDKLPLDRNRVVYLHLLLTQQTVNEYKKMIGIVNYIKYHINTRVTVGFIIGKDTFSDNMSKEQVDVVKKLLFYCSAERWSDTELKLKSLMQNNIPPCKAPGFCTTNSCTIDNGDVILFFNTRRTTYDKFIQVIYNNASDVYKTSSYSLPIYSMIQLDTKFNIPCFSKNMVYDSSLANILAKANKKTLIITAEQNLSLVNFLANGLEYVNNPNIQFMKLDYNYLSVPANITNIIDNSLYDLIIFDYHMDVSRTINDLKAQLEAVDFVLGWVANICVNKHSLFITSLYGIKKTLPLASYNSETVTLDYQLEIPIFFFDYSYPRSKYTLFPGEPHDVLTTAISCIWSNNELNNLIHPKGLINNILGAFSKK